jgi:formamidopyrimidine-DNA glycosylase
MPELPEVETVARQLRPSLVSRRVEALRILDPRLREGPVPRVAGRTVLDVFRCGKQVLIRFSPPPGRRDPLWLAVHLRMTGRLIWTPPGAPAPDRIRARFRLDRGALVFADTRRFGTFRWYRDPLDAAPAGVDPLSSELTPRRWHELINGSRQNMKSWLLRQDRLVGLGNIYASEILHRARISPHREARSLDGRERARIHRATREILTRAIEACGTTFSDFQDARGVEGSFQTYLRVYGRENERCRRCGGTIVREVQQQRSTFHCAGCQR